MNICWFWLSHSAIPSPITSPKSIKAISKTPKTAELLIWTSYKRKEGSKIDSKWGVRWKETIDSFGGSPSFISFLYVPTNSNEKWETGNGKVKGHKSLNEFRIFIIYALKYPMEIIELPSSRSHFMECKCIQSDLWKYWHPIRMGLQWRPRILWHLLLWGTHGEWWVAKAEEGKLCYWF